MKSLPGSLQGCLPEAMSHRHGQAQEICRTPCLHWARSSGNQLSSRQTPRNLWQLQSTAAGQRLLRQIRHHSVAVGKRAQPLTLPAWRRR